MLPKTYLGGTFYRKGNVMDIKIIDRDFTVCKLKDTYEVDFKGDFCFAAKTDEEISLVCETAFVPENTIEREDGWKAMRIEGQLDFSLIGILSKLSSVLAENGIGIFAVSTYNTDYILVKHENIKKAASALKKKGYSVMD